MRGYAVHGFRTVGPRCNTGFMLDLAPLVAALVLYGARGPVAESQVRLVLGVSSTRWAQLLNRLIDTELALQLDPIAARRLRAVRESRRLVG